MEINERINYWRYRPGTVEEKQGEGAEDYWLPNWELDKKQKVMQQMQARIGDVSDKAKYPNKKAVEAVRPDNPGRARNCWDLCYKMQIGDIIFAVGPGERILGVGKVVSEYYYVDESPRFHRRDVEWLSTEEHNAHHGLQQGSLSRFDLTKEANRKTLQNLLDLYSEAFGESKPKEAPSKVIELQRQTAEENRFVTIIGKTVTHKKFGQGTVLSVDNEVTEVQFSEGVKRLTTEMAFGKKLLTVKE